MRLEQVRVANFRSCSDARIDFGPFLTLLVGENDAGKSNVIDAIRAALPPASGRGAFWFDRDRDLTYGESDGTSIEISRTYSELTSGEDALFSPALVDEHRKLVHTTIYRTDSRIPRRHRLSHSVGDSRVPDPEPELRERVAHVYLPPLRDAAAVLDSADGNRLADVLEMVASPDEVAAFEASANDSLNKLTSEDIARRAVTRVQSHLTSVTRPVRHRVIDIKHRTQRLRRLARAFRLHMAAEGFTPADLLGSGLGYANLLFIATVVLELERAEEFDLVVLLVEEPEAHLHPQLQSVLLAYLQEQAVESVDKRSDQSILPAGRVQVVATTHSPHLASSVSTQNIVIVRSQQKVIDSIDDASDGSADEASQPHHAVTRAIALAAVPLDDKVRRKIDRYLDATRAALLFARQIMLVEGIAEAILLRAFAEYLVFPKSADSGAEADVNREMREQFRAVSIIAVDGVDFLPYLQILLSEEYALADRVVVVTDGDEGAGGIRKSEIEAAFDNHVASGCLAVYVGDTTLEAELFAAVANESLLRAAFQPQHPRSLAKWDAIAPPASTGPADRSAAFSRALKEKKLDLGKGDFAHVISELLRDLSTPSDFAVPGYLRDAIHAATIKSPPDLSGGAV